MIGNLADDACTPSHTRRLFEAIGHPDKEMHEIPGANHYYSGPDQRGTLRQAVGIVTDWLLRHGFASAAVTADRPAGRHPRHRGRHADLRPVRRPAARRHGRRGHQDRAARRARPAAHLGPGRTRRAPLLLDGARAQQEGRHAEPARGQAAASCSWTWSRTPTSSWRTSGRARWRSGTWVMTCCANAIGASSWSGCRATARPDPTPTRPATPRWPRPPAGCGT